MLWTRSKRNKTISKALLALEKQEARLSRKALKPRTARWKEELEARIPSKVYGGLESAFCKGFSLVFRHGTAVIEKGVRKEALLADHAALDETLQKTGKAGPLKKMRRHANRADALNLAVTALEGIGLGALGIGMPDIVLFLGTLLKGVYETSLRFGFGYDTRQEQLLILKLLAAALSTGEDWLRRNGEVDQMLIWETPEVTEEELRQQIRETASVFAMDMLLLKFIQGMPVVGILGGAANPVYYQRIMTYVQLKYRKRYLLIQQSRRERHSIFGGLRRR